MSRFIIRFFSKQKPKKAMGITEWSGESAPPPCICMTAGHIDFARIQENATGRIAEIDCGEFNSDCTFALHKCDVLDGEQIEVSRLNLKIDLEAALDEAIKPIAAGYGNIIRKADKEKFNDHIS